MITLEEAKARVAASTPEPERAEVPVREAAGLVIAEPVVATEAIPPFANTSVDGFALLSVDTLEAPSRLRIIGEVRAGASGDLVVGRGQAARIMTGAPIPVGADAVVMVEDTEVVDDDVIVSATVPPGSAIRPAGDDVKIGDVVLTEGTVLRATHLGLLAELGRVNVPVYRRPRIGVVMTGDELVADGSPLGPGQIRESNDELLVALVTETGCVAVDYGVVRDDVDAISEMLETASAECDAIVTSGGVSMGEYDLVKVVLGKLGAMEWMQILIKPAKPFAFGRIGERRTPVFGLPGNPVSSFVSYELIARPAIRHMMGYRENERPNLVAIADVAMKKPSADQRVHYVRVDSSFGDDGRLHVRPTGAQGSHQLAASASANGLARLEGGGVEAGGEVRVRYLG